MSKTYKFKRLLTRRYQFLALILLLLASGLVLLPKYIKNEGIPPAIFVKNVLSMERYISSDQLAEKLIEQDPSLLLIDIRPETEYVEFSLPNAINIPLDSILEDNFETYLDQEIYDIVFISNDQIQADQAWMICNRLGYKNQFVLSGGLNEWFHTIINPTYPSETMPKEAFDLYSFRKASGMYFGVGLVRYEIVNEPKQKATKEPAKKVIPIKKKKKRMPEGGC